MNVEGTLSDYFPILNNYNSTITELPPTPNENATTPQINHPSKPESSHERVLLETTPLATSQSVGSARKRSYTPRSKTSKQQKVAEEIAASNKKGLMITPS